MIEDWLFSDESSVCHFRVAGVLVRNDKIFLQRHKNEYALPGGHVSFGETSQDALVREFKEEVGVDITCKRLIWVEENFWNWGSKKAHNISFYYVIDLTNDRDIADDFVSASKDNSEILFQWVNIEELEQITVYPSFIKNEVNNISDNDNVKHFMRNEW